MRFYRVHYSQDGGNSGGFSWHTVYREAEAAAFKAAKNDPEEYERISPASMIDAITLSAPTKRAILAFLNRYASHNDNG